MRRAKHAERLGSVRFVRLRLHDAPGATLRDPEVRPLRIGNVEGRVLVGKQRNDPNILHIIDVERIATVQECRESLDYDELVTVAPPRPFAE